MLTAQQSARITDLASQFTATQHTAGRRPKYHPANWYWAVAGLPTEVYSSKRAAYVALTDPTYLSFLKHGGKATKIDSAASLAEVLAKFPACYPPGAAATTSTAAKTA
jgi:hypothetical protein